MRGCQGHRFVMLLYQKQYIVKIFPEYSNDFYILRSIIYITLNLLSVNNCWCFTLPPKNLYDADQSKDARMSDKE